MARKKKVVYPFSPLVEVVFEIRFPSEPVVECKRNEFFETVREQFPCVIDPEVSVGLSSSARRYHFKSSGGDETVTSSINSFAYATRSYDGFEKFGPKALKFAKTFCNMYKIRKLDRTGLRYVNIIPFLREDGVIPWKRFFSVDVTLPKALPSDFMNINVSYESRCGEGTITTKIACVKFGDNEQEAFILDFDFAKNGPANARDLGAILDESHDNTKRIFENMISDDYRKVMLGEVYQ